MPFPFCLDAYEFFIKLLPPTDASQQPRPRRGYEPGSAQMAAEELARDREHTGAILATGFWSSARMFADLHPERSGRLVEIGPIEERVRQTINQAKRRLVSPGLQRFVQQDRSSRRSTPSRVA
jgi:hypothetical protein